MIPDIAIIISTYAVARLLCEYLIEGDKLKPLRIIVAALAVGVIGSYLLEVLNAAKSLPDLNI